MTSQTITLVNNVGLKPHAGSSDFDLDKAVKAVETSMLNIINSDIDVLRDASRHIINSGGKRIRPKVVLLSYVATGGTDIDYAVPPAAAIELVHTASVVHDDINDHGVVRRGRPSVNALWGRTFALLTGDFLFTKVYELMSPYGDLNILFARAAIALVEGETLQAAAVKNNTLTSEIYFKIIALKTAELFRAGAMLGAKLNDAPEAHVEALAQYGYNVGMAFQIVDDILDVIGDESELGKTANLDKDQGKGFTSVQEDDVMNNVKQKLMDGERLIQARLQAEQFVEWGISAIDVLPASPAKDALIDLAKVVIERQF
ncbi:MAG: polyprenyl synthetase family protein [Phototrophicales bacterium]|nr:polyprenyl synthetase family protein [Phototrophicales bacterium]